MLTSDSPVKGQGRISLLTSSKIWSRGPLPGPPLEHVGRLQTYFNDLSAPAPDPLERLAFSYLYGVATRAFKAHDSVEAAYAQIIVRPLPNVSQQIRYPPSSGKAVLTDRRQWYISCSFVRSTSHTGGFTRPWFLLESGIGSFESIFTKDTRLPWRIYFTLGGCLKPDITPHRGQDANDSTLGELHSAVDAYFQATLATIYKRSFSTIQDLAATVRIRFQALLPGSLFTRALDMHSLEVVCVLQDGTRYVDTVLLNDDGTVNAEQARDDDLFQAPSKVVRAESSKASTSVPVASKDEQPEIVDMTL